MDTNILDVHGQPISLEWALEFGGYFMADGCLFISRHSRADNPYGWSFQPQARIGQRIDSLPLLRAIQAKLGGYIRQYTGKHRSRNGRVYQCNPTAVWTTSSQEEAERVISLLELLQLPHRKTAQVQVMREFLEIRRRARQRGPNPNGALTGIRYTQEEYDRMYECYRKLRMLKQYRGG